MKEKKNESFFLFRKSGTRYSFISDKKKPEISNVQIQRLSWSSFPMAKLSVPEESCKRVDTPSRRSKSSENLKKQAKNLNKLSKSKSSSVFKSSSSTMKNIFTIGSSSPSASSSSSSASSSPKVRQSWSSGVTHILERCGNDLSGECGDDSSLLDDFQRQSNGNLLEGQFKNGLTTEGFSNNKYNFLNCTRNGFPVASLLEEDEEDEIMITPKIICAHKKTPDVVRKPKNQIIQELEYIQKLGMLPEELETKIVSNGEGENENISSNYENYPYVNGDLDLNSLRGYKTAEENNCANLQEKQSKETSEDNNKNDHRDFSTHKQDKSQDKKSIANDLNPCNVSYLQINESQTSAEFDNNDSDEYFGSSAIVLEKNGFSNTLKSSSLNSILTQDDSEADDSEAMTNEDDDSESLSFEKRLEDNLEKLDERGDSKENETNAFSDEEEKVILRRKLRSNLHIDIEKARSIKTLSNDHLLRRITEEGSNSTRSSRSSPRTPRSPAIDIDDLFKQKQKQIDESAKDNLTQVKDLTQRLRLPTKPPSHVEWINGIKNKRDARQLAEVMSPVVTENAEGVFQQQMIKEPTEEQREKNLSKALLWIKEELVKMKEQDQKLARQLVHLQLEMQRLRLLRSCTQHEALLEEVTCEEEEQRAFMTSTNLIDLPNNQRECGAFSSLRDFGVTRMNIANRRFTLR